MQLLSIGNKMICGTEDAPLQCILILASHRLSWLRVFSSISINRPNSLTIIPKLSSIHRSKGSPLMEIQPRNPEKFVSIH